MPCPDLGVSTSSGAWGDLWRLYLPLGWRTRVFWQFMWLRLPGNKIRFVLGRSKRFDSFHGFIVLRGDGTGKTRRGGSGTLHGSLGNWVRYEQLAGSLGFEYSDIYAPRLLRRASQARFSTEQAVSRRISQSPRLQYTSTGKPCERQSIFNCSRPLGLDLDG
jgi:hypothetical protein